MTSLCHDYAALVGLMVLLLSTASVLTLQEGREHGLVEEPAAVREDPVSVKQPLRGGDISFANLTAIDLRFYEGISCRGPPCSTGFGLCPSPFPVSLILANISAARRLRSTTTPSTPIAACWNEGFQDEEAWTTQLPGNFLRGRLQPHGTAKEERLWRPMYAGQMYLLENVFINDRGSVFNQEHFFLHGLTCVIPPVDFGTYPANATRVTSFDTLLSFAYGYGGNFYHAMAEGLPNLVVASYVLRRHPRIPIAHVARQERFLWTTELLGVPHSSLNFHPLSPGDLFFARRLYLPAQALCSSPSRAMVRQMRRHFFLPKTPLRLLQDEIDWGSKPHAESIADDWVVILGRRTGSSRKMIGWEEIEAAVEKLVPPGRFVVFNGSLTMDEARLLFRRAVLLIASHGALMTNMLFMQPGGAVVEVRPRDYDNNVLHPLAEQCELDYYMMHADGNQTSDMVVNIPDLLFLVREVLESVVP